MADISLDYTLTEEGKGVNISGNKEKHNDGDTKDETNLKRLKVPLQPIKPRESENPATNPNNMERSLAHTKEMHHLSIPISVPHTSNLTEKRANVGTSSNITNVANNPTSEPQMPLNTMHKYPYTHMKIIEQIRLKRPLIYHNLRPEARTPNMWRVGAPNETQADRYANSLRGSGDHVGRAGKAPRHLHGHTVREGHTRPTSNMAISQPKRRQHN
jgi:hypothetical protein